MAHELSYKLGRYKITETLDGGLWWESHHGVGSTRKGKCTIEGSILILGPSEIEEPGFLIREFMIHLDKLPNWDKTTYYCLSYSIHKCKTGGRLSFPTNMGEQAGALRNDAKRFVNEPLNNRETIKIQANVNNEVIYFKKKLYEVWVLLKDWLMRSLR